MLGLVIAAALWPLGFLGLPARISTAPHNALLNSSSYVLLLPFSWWVAPCSKDSAKIVA